ncbi:ATP-binding protein [uncultured Streptomyces sp.]|uniref:ATP-binding protein n=1 Tax=uncultured Streptomyces sp. TaxID=174707 RepID=UPI00261BA78A|nr:ATP-binding protein [uncultured Streptomyces sp.]
METLLPGQVAALVPVFVQRFSSTPRGARLARHLALHELNDWGVLYRSDASESAALIVAELAANAVTHGRVPGRDFELRLTYVPGDERPFGVVRIEVTDTKGERLPPGPGDLAAQPVDAEADGGRGLRIVEALADRWAVLDRAPHGGPGKTVRAELDLPYRPAPGLAPAPEKRVPAGQPARHDET